MVKKCGTISTKLCALQRIFYVQNTKYKQSNVQELPARSKKVLDIRSPEAKWVKFWWPSIVREGGLNRTRQADSSVISEYTNLKKLLVVGREKRSILQDIVKCVLHISKVKLQGGSNMTGTDLCVNKQHCAAAVRPWESEATTSTLPPARVTTCSVLSGSC